MIKRHRLKKGLSRKEVAERLNISLHEYDQYEACVYAFDALGHSAFVIRIKKRKGPNPNG